MDTKKAKEIWLKIYNFINKYLRPHKPFKNLKEINEAAYRQKA